MIRYEYDNWVMTLPQTYVHRCDPVEGTLHLTYTQLVTHDVRGEDYTYDIICTRCLTKMKKATYERFGKVLQLLDPH